MIDGAPVIVSGDEDGTIRCWDARTGRPKGKRLKARAGWRVRSVALGMIDGAPVIVSGDEDGAILRWDVRTGESYQCSLLAIGASVWATDTDDNGEVIVGWGRGIALFELPTLRKM